MANDCPELDLLEDMIRKRYTDMGCWTFRMFNGKHLVFTWRLLKCHIHNYKVNGPSLKVSCNYCTLIVYPILTPGFSSGQQHYRLNIGA
jgi:hypothetical protein